MNSNLRTKLIESSIKAKEKAHCPYSSFRVGCALLTDDDTILTGCNVENASYGLSICAERTALTKAVSDGHKKFKEIAITSDLTDVYLTPCGACRQFMSEFGMDLKVLLVKTPNDYVIHTLEELLPFAFDSSKLDVKKRHE